MYNANRQNSSNKDIYIGMAMLKQDVGSRDDGMQQNS